MPNKTKFVVNFLETAKEHRAADKQCGRAWTCGCVACLKIKAAAPELLEAAKGVVDLCQSANIALLRGKDDIARLLSAIAKAEGGAK